MSRDVNEPILDVSRDVIEPILDERIFILRSNKVYSARESAAFQIDFMGESGVQLRVIMNNNGCGVLWGVVFDG